MSEKTFFSRFNRYINHFFRMKLWNFLSTLYSIEKFSTGFSPMEKSPTLWNQLKPFCNDTHIESNCDCVHKNLHYWSVMRLEFKPPILSNLRSIPENHKIVHSGIQIVWQAVGWWWKVWKVSQQLGTRSTRLCTGAAGRLEYTVTSIIFFNIIQNHNRQVLKSVYVYISM